MCVCALSAGKHIMSKPTGSFSFTREKGIFSDGNAFTGPLSAINVTDRQTLMLPTPQVDDLFVKDGKVHKPHDRKPFTGTVVSLEKGANTKYGPFIKHHFVKGLLKNITAQAKIAPDGTIPSPGSNKPVKDSAVEPYTFKSPNQVTVIKSGWDAPGKKRASRKW